jgi:hypothetical protein
MRKIGFTIAAAATVLTAFAAPANAGCKSVTKIFESGSRTVTQKIKVCDNSGSEANDSQGGKGSASQGSGPQSSKGSASQGNGSQNRRPLILLLRPVPVRPVFVRRVFMGPVL